MTSQGQAGGGCKPAKPTPQPCPHVSPLVTAWLLCLPKPQFPCLHDRCIALPPRQRCECDSGLKAESKPPSPLMTRWGHCTMSSWVTLTGAQGLRW